MNNSKIIESRAGEGIPPVTFKEKFERFRERVHDNRYLLWAFFIPLVVMFFAYVALGCWPFGKNSVLVLDMNGQYVYFFEYLRDVVYGKVSLGYSWSRQLGGEFFGTYTYYLASPLSYIVALFPKEHVLEAIWLIILLKVGICGVTMSYFLQKSRPGSKWKACIFGVLYALLGFTFAYSHNVFWMDALMWFPLVILGAEQVIKNRRFTLFVSMLALTLMSTFYIGFMVCIFVFFYFFAYYFSREDGFLRPVEPIVFTGIWKRLGFSRFEGFINKTKNRRAIAKFLGTLIRFGFYAAIAIGISAVIILITNFAMHFGKDSFAMTAGDYHYTWRSLFITKNYSKTVNTLAEWNELSWYQKTFLFDGSAVKQAMKFWEANPAETRAVSSNVTSLWGFNPLESIFKFFPGSGDTVDRTTMSDGVGMPATPFLYCGLISVLFAPLYFTLKRISLRRKLAYGGLLAVLGISMVVKPIDILWHMGQVPNWLYYRYSFMFCFVTILIAYVAFTYINEIKLQHISFTVACIAVGIVFVLIQDKSADYSYVEKYGYYYELTCVAITVVFLAAIFLLSYFYRKGGIPKKIFMVLLTVVILSEATYSAIAGEIVLNMRVSYTNRENYDGFMDRTQPMVDAVKAYDDGFYRMEKTFHRKTNDNMSLNMYGLSNSTSSLNKATIELLRDMGYTSHAHWSKYVGGNPVSDSLLGIKYILGASETAEYWPSSGRQEPGKEFLKYYYEEIKSIMEDESSFPIYDNKPYYSDQFIKGAIEAFYNKYALSIAYAVNADILGVDLNLNPENNAFINAAYNGNLYGPIDSLNAMMSGMLGRKTDIFVPLEMSKYRNVKNAASSDSTNSNTPEPAHYVNPNGRIGYSRKEGTDSNGKAYRLSVDFAFKLEADKPTPVYFYVPLNGYESNVQFYRSFTYDDKNGSTKVYNEPVKAMGTFGGNETARIIYLGMYGVESDKVKVPVDGKEIEYDVLEVEYVVTLSTETKWGLIWKENTSFFYVIDEPLMEAAFADLASAQMAIDSKKSTETHLYGTINIPKGSDKTVLFTSIPYDPSWVVLIDGKPAEILLNEYTRPTRIPYKNGYMTEIDVFVEEFLKENPKITPELLETHKDLVAKYKKDNKTDSNPTITELAKLIAPQKGRGGNGYLFEDQTYTEPTLQSLIAVMITEGEHTVEFIYKPKALTQGLVISGISLVGFIGLVALEFVWGGYKKKSTALEPEYEYIAPSALKKLRANNSNKTQTRKIPAANANNSNATDSDSQNKKSEQAIKIKPQQNGNKNKNKSSNKRKR